MEPLKTRMHPVGLAVFVAQVDNAKAVPVWIGENDEIGVIRIAVPLNLLGPERD
jgi:hypothetical protein